MSKTPSPLKALCLVVERAGSQSALARHLGVSQAAVWKWLNIMERMSADNGLVIRAEELTGISRHWLRPDIYPVESSPPPVFIGVDRRMAPVAAAARTVPSRDAKAA